MAVAFPGDGTLIATTSLPARAARPWTSSSSSSIIGSAAAALRRRRRRGLARCAGACGRSRRWPAQADRITAGDLTDRVSPQDAGTEVGRLGAALNGMLARIEASVAEREASQQLTRRFFADASHELRNPLASLRANAELYQQGALPGRAQVDEAMRRITLEAQRMGGLVDDMLRLARLDQHPGQQRELVRRQRPGDRVRASGPGPDQPGNGPGAATSPTAWRSPGTRKCCAGRSTTCSPTSARTRPRAAPPSSPRPARQDACGRSRSATTAPACPPTSLPASSTASTGPGSHRRRPGSGLGLAIAAAIAAAHDGHVTARPGEPHGLRVTLILPTGSPHASQARDDAEGQADAQVGGRSGAAHIEFARHSRGSRRVGRQDAGVTWGAIRVPVMPARVRPGFAWGRSWLRRGGAVNLAAGRAARGLLGHGVPGTPVFGVLHR